MRGKAPASETIREAPLLDRGREVEAIESSLDQLGAGIGGVLVIEGPAGIGKTRLIRELAGRAAERGIRVCAASGSEMEQEFGFGVVRQLLGPPLASLDGERRERLLSGSASLATGVFGIGDEGFSTTAEEGALYGLYWLVANIAEEGPLLLVVDDAHWADGPSLRFARYLGRRLSGLEVTVVLAARPAEPGAQGGDLAELVEDADATVIRPGPLGPGATFELIRGRLETVPKGLGDACLRATGGNPFLIGEFLAEVESGGPLPAGDDAEIGRARIGASIVRRAARLRPEAPALVRAIAILGDRARLDVLSKLAGIELGEASTLVASLSAADILAADSQIRFAHPLLRQSVLDDIPAAERAAAHGRAAALLRERDVEAEVVASHVLNAHPGSVSDAVAILDEAAQNAERRGAPGSAKAYLSRAVEEPSPAPVRAGLLERLGNAELSLREPTAIGHLELAADTTDDPEVGVAITVQLVDALSLAGLWDDALDALERGFERAGGAASVLDLEAMRAGARAYDPAHREEFDRDLPRLLSLASDRSDDDPRLLRWLLAGIGSLAEAPAAQVLELASVDPATVTLEHRPGYESSLVSQGILALPATDQLDDCDAVVAALLADGKRRGSIGATIVARLYGATVAERRGDLFGAEADFRLAVELAQENDFGLMMLTTGFLFCCDSLIERDGLADIADFAVALELPPRFAATMSGAMLLEVKGAIRLARGERSAACDDLRAAAPLARQLHTGPRLSRWRSRLALSLPPEDRGEAIALARDELDLARRLNSPRAEGGALRTLGLLEGGAAGLEYLQRSVDAARRCPSAVEVARSLAALGGALRRAGQRSEARERLREGLEVARRTGAERLAREIVEEMRMAGARLPDRELSGVRSLTPAERRVAVAAASGATNREIAQDLFVSLRTVEMHLTNAYRKLEISSRGELARALGDRSGDDLS